MSALFNPGARSRRMNLNSFHDTGEMEAVQAAPGGDLGQRQQRDDVFIIGRGLASGTGARRSSV